MTPIQFLTNLQNHLNNLAIGTNLDGWEFIGKDTATAFNTIGGPWNAAIDPGYEFKKGSQRYLLRPVVQGPILATEAIHLQNQLVNYNLSKKGVFHDLGNQVVIKDTFSATVKTKIAKATVRDAMEKAGFAGDVITTFKVEETDYDSIIAQFLTWAAYRERAKEIIRTSNPGIILDEVREINEEEEIPDPLNTILYGPPGAGKTYSTIDRAVAIADGQSAGNHADNKKRFDQLRADGRIEFITFHQNYSYEDFVTGLRPEPGAHTLKFERVPGIFMDIATRARENWERSKISSPNAPVVVEPSFDDVFYSFFQKLIEEEVPGVEIKMRSKSFSITKIDFEDQHIKFTKNSGGTGHDLVISIVKGIYDGSRTYRQDGLGIYYFPLVDALKEHSKQIKKPVPTEALLNYVLIIDEINRANISRVFGELITLLEDDKRLGEENELRVTLPGGIRDFGVPPNLHIIGTMNTADKSIALVDIALRRRFEFVGMYPTSALLDQLVSEGRISESGQRLLQTLNTGIFKNKNTADFLIGHAYLFGKMQDAQIEDVIQKKIIPLLMEYFSGRHQEVSDLFNNSGWKVRYNEARFEWEIAQS